MVALLRLLASFVADLFKSRRRLEAEILRLRHQLNIDGSFLRADIILGRDTELPTVEVGSVLVQIT